MSGQNARPPFSAGQIQAEPPEAVKPMIVVIAPFRRQAELLAAACPA